MGNALLDLGKKDGLSFVVGGGAGYAKVRYSGVKGSPTSGFILDGNDAGFAWQLIAGVRYPVSKKIDVTAKYRYFNAGNRELVGFGGRAVEGTFQSHSLMAGASFNF